MPTTVLPHAAADEADFGGASFAGVCRSRGGTVRGFGLWSFVIRGDTRPLFSASSLAPYVQGQFMPIFELVIILLSIYKLKCFFVT